MIEISLSQFLSLSLSLSPSQFLSLQVSLSCGHLLDSDAISTSLYAAPQTLSNIKETGIIKSFVLHSVSSGSRT